MNPRLILLLALPLLLLGLIWHLHDTPASPEPTMSRSEREATSRSNPRRIINQSAPAEFLSWVGHYQSDPDPDSLRQGMLLARERRETLKQLI